MVPADPVEAPAWPPTFRDAAWPAAAFVLAFALWVMVSNGLATLVLGPDPSHLAEAVWTIPSGIVQAGIALAVLRHEGVRLRDLGLARPLLVPALVLTGGFVVAVNLVAAGLIGLAGDSLTVGPYAIYSSPPLNLSAATLLASAVAQYVFTGPVEELAFRGYLQNKLIALFGGRTDRARPALGVVATGAVFAALHVPTLLLIRGTPPGQVVGTLLLLAVSGIAFGTIYELTHNLYLVMFLHGIGNWWPLVVDPGVRSWPNWGAVFVLYAIVVVAYRLWARDGRDVSTVSA